MIKRGRPKVPDDIAINKKFIVRMSNSEKEKLDKLSKKFGVGKAELLRKLLNAMYDIVKEEEDENILRSSNF